MSFLCFCCFVTSAVSCLQELPTRLVTAGAVSVLFSWTCPELQVERLFNTIRSCLKKGCNSWRLWAFQPGLARVRKTLACGGLHVGPQSQKQTSENEVLGASWPRRSSQSKTEKSSKNLDFFFRLHFWTIAAPWAERRWGSFVDPFLQLCALAHMTPEQVQTVQAKSQWVQLCDYDKGLLSIQENAEREKILLPQEVPRHPNESSCESLPGIPFRKCGI